jgi:hypothetical protein
MLGLALALECKPSMLMAIFDNADFAHSCRSDERSPE